MTIMELQAVLSLKDSGFTSGLNSASQQGKSLAESLGADAESIKSAFSNAFSFSVGQLMADGFRSALGFARDFSMESIEAASNLEEIQNVIDVVFGENAATMYAWASTSKDAFGMATVNALDYAGEIASVLRTQGFQPTEVVEMSQAIVELAADYASFRNKSFEETFAMLRSGLRGETESIEQLGLSVHVATMVEYLGLEKETDFTKHMSQMEQIQARYDYIMENSSFVQGDFSRTQDSFANQMKTLESNILSLKTAIGDDFLPLATEVLKFFNGFFEEETDATDVTQSLTESFTSTYAEILKTSESALSLVDALAELEKGGLTDGEQSQWESLVSRIADGTTALGGVVDSNLETFNDGAEAIRNYILALTEASIEEGRAGVFASYREELGRQQAEAAEARVAADAAAQNAIDVERLWDQVWENALNYTNETMAALWGEAVVPLTAEEITRLIGDPIWLQQLNMLGDNGDAQARAYFDLINSLENPEDARRAAEEAERAYQLEAADVTSLSAQIEALTAAINAMTNTVPVVNNTFTVDGQEVASAVAPRVAAEMHRDVIRQRWVE